MEHGLYARQAGAGQCSPAGEFFRTGPACVRPFVRGMAPRGLVDGPLRSLYDGIPGRQRGSQRLGQPHRHGVAWRGAAAGAAGHGDDGSGAPRQGPCPQSDGSRTGRLGPHLRRRLSLCQRHGAGVLPQIRLRPRAGACLHTAAARPGRRSGGGRFCAAGHGHAGRARAAAALL